MFLMTFSVTKVHGDFLLIEPQKQDDFWQKSNQSVDTITITLKAFYNEYITAQSLPGLDKQKIDSILDKYVTSELLSFIGKLSYDELDFDPFLESQMADVEMLKSLKILRDPNRKNIYQVTYSYGKYTSSIGLHLIKINGVYKIDTLTNLTQHLKSIGYFQKQKSK